MRLLGRVRSHSVRSSENRATHLHLFAPKSAMLPRRGKVSSIFLSPADAERVAWEGEC
jgi:hypothetical protein